MLLAAVPAFPCEPGYGARVVAAWVFGLVVQCACDLKVPLSLGTCLASVGTLNSGLPQRDRTVVYGTAKDGTQNLSG